MQNPRNSHLHVHQVFESDSVQNHIDKRFAHSAANELKNEFVKVNVLKSEIN